MSRRRFAERPVRGERRGKEKQEETQREQRQLAVVPGEWGGGEVTLLRAAKDSPSRCGKEEERDADRSGERW